jgi:hypothetical protein
MHVGICNMHVETQHLFLMKRNRAERKALKEAVELSQAESGEDAVSEAEERDDNYSCVSLLPPSSRIPRTCTVLRANLFIANPIHNAYPDTQAEVSVTNRTEHVVRKNPRSAKLQGLLGKPQVAQYTDLAFRLKTDKGRAIVLRLSKPGLILPEAKEILLEHQDLEDAGFRVNYHTGRMQAPGGHAITVIKRGSVWQIPVMPSTKHTVLAATTTPATTTLTSTTMQDVELMHEVLCCVGATTMLRYYKHYHGTGFGKASTAAVGNFRCPIKTLMQGDANPKRQRTQDAQTEWTPPPPQADTTDVHAHVAHSDAEDYVCACCADQPSKCVQFTATEPWPTLRGSASEPPAMTVPALERRKNMKRKNSNHRSQTATAGQIITGKLKATQMVADLWLRGSVQQERLHNHQLRGL